MAIETIEDLPGALGANSSVDVGTLPSISLGIPDWITGPVGTALTLSKYAAIIGIGIGSLYLIYRGFQYSVTHNYFFAQPPTGFGLMVYRSLSTDEVERPKKHYGKAVMKTIVDENGNKSQIQETETIRLINGRLLGEIINLNGYVVYPATGDICRLGHYHDSVSGLDIPIGKIYNPKFDAARDTDEFDEAKNIRQAGSVDPIERVIKPEKEEQFINDPDQEAISRRQKEYDQILQRSNWLAKSIRDGLGIEWIGRYPLILDKVPELDVFWEERKDVKLPAVPRRVRRSTNRITQTSQAIDLIDPPVIEAGGYPWKFQITILWRLANLRTGWVQIPDSADQASQKIVDAFLSFIQDLFVLQYEGMDKKGTGPKDPKELEKKKLGTLSNKVISEEFYKFLKVHGYLHYIRETLGREIGKDGVIIQNKALDAPYDTLITEVRTAEIRLRTTKIEAEGDLIRQAKRAEGTNLILDAYEKHSEVGPIFAATGGAPLAQGKGEPLPAARSDPVDRLVSLTAVNTSKETLGKKKEPPEKTNPVGPSDGGQRKEGGRGNNRRRRKR